MARPIQYRVVATDPPGPDLTIEHEILANVGAEVVHRPALTEDAVIAAIADADAVLCDAAPISAKVLDAAPRLRIASEYGIGVDNIDCDAATARGVWVGNVPGFCAPEVADHTLALLLTAARQIVPLDAAVRAKGWDSLDAYPLQCLAGQTLGLVGLGAIGRAVARRARGFDLRVRVYSPRSAATLASELGAEATDLDTIFRESDYVSLHVPATPTTRGLVDARRLGLMKPTAWLINTARGAVVDEAALLAALREGRLAGAALDVRAPEPPAANDPFRDLPNVILTPHASYRSPRALRELRERAARNVAAVLEGGTPNDPVNPAVASAYRTRFGG